MKNVLLLILVIFSVNPIEAQNQDPWTEYMTPSGMHDMLKKYVGEFQMEISMDMGEGFDQSKIPVDSHHLMLLGGRYLELKQTGNMMGMEYESITIMGFNNSDKSFALTTITNMGTGTLSLFGDWDEETNSANVSGQLTNPMTKGRINVRQTISFVDADTILIESFDQEGNSKEKKTVEYRLMRK
ncbi:DUF1579 family protein [Pararhodonellum marinum]|uniref:DUF1579 family protein n=1 Tax=Pararhodonellum marinum TaxID=2755358 RepID=UPI00188F5586|nr:DUF1579 family protein [Pararhodonellum marinum]